MRSAWQKWLRRASPLLLVALLFVPVVLSGHHHAAGSTAPCASCALTHHTPVVATATAAAAIGAPLVVPVEPAARAMRPASALRLPTVRGPPTRCGSQPA